MPPRVTFSITEIIAVRIRGEKREFPQVPADDGLVGRFLKWCIEQDIGRLPGAGFSGGGGHLGFYYKDDLPRISAWLAENKAVWDDVTTWGIRDG